MIAIPKLDRDVSRSERELWLATALVGLDIAARLLPHARISPR